MTYNATIKTKITGFKGIDPLRSKLIIYNQIHEKLKSLKATI